MTDLSNVITALFYADPVLFAGIGCLFCFMLGLLIGAWWQGRPISEAEKRVEIHTREADVTSEMIGEDK